jgi:polar amino acid transport system ATP-binding protein
VNAAIDARDVFRVHQTPEGDAAALQGLSLTVREGETVTVLGPSGSGKSTFLRILAGLDRPSAGTVRVFGTELGKLPAGDVARYRTRIVGYADQHYARALAPELSARELVGLRLGLAGATAPERHRRADELLERVGLADKRDVYPGKLSGGQQQRVAIARALAMNPALMLFDEATSALDPEVIGEVLTVMEEIAREGMTMIVVTHEMGFARVAADRVAMLDDGRIIEEGPPEQFFSAPAHERTRQFLSKIL